MNRRSFKYTKFGFKFQIIINNTTTTAILLRDNKNTYFKIPFVGIARLTAPDKYNFEIGRTIAIRAAMQKYRSAALSYHTKRLYGFKSQLKNFDNILKNTIINTRKLTDI